LDGRCAAREERRLQQEQQGDSTRPTGQREDDGTERAENGTGSNPGGSSESMDVEGLPESDNTDKEKQKKDESVMKAKSGEKIGSCLTKKMPRRR
jgi:hypothetical protein